MTIKDHDDPTLTRAAKALLIICAHGSAKHPAANQHVLDIVENLRRSGVFLDVQTVFHASTPGNIDPGFLNNPDINQIVLVPYMMSDGLLAERMIANAQQDIRNTGLSVPITGTLAVGTHPLIAKLTIELSSDQARHNNERPQDLSLVIVAHGSRNAPQSRLAATEHYKLIKSASVFRETHLTFIEEPPFIADTLQTIQGPAIIVGLFAAPGGHAITDIAEAIAGTNRSDLIDAGPIGMHQGISDLVAQRAIDVIRDAIGND